MKDWFKLFGMLTAIIAFAVVPTILICIVCVALLRYLGWI